MSFRVLKPFIKQFTNQISYTYKIDKLLPNCSINHCSVNADDGKVTINIHHTIDGIDKKATITFYLDEKFIDCEIIDQNMVKNDDHVLLNIAFGQLIKNLDEKLQKLNLLFKRSLFSKMKKVREINKANPKLQLLIEQLSDTISECDNLSPISSTATTDVTYFSPTLPKHALFNNINSINKTKIVETLTAKKTTNVATTNIATSNVNGTKYIKRCTKGYELYFPLDESIDANILSQTKNLEVKLYGVNYFAKLTFENSSVELIYEIPREIIHGKNVNYSAQFDSKMNSIVIVVTIEKHGNLAQIATISRQKTIDYMHDENTGEDFVIYKTKCNNFNSGDYAFSFDTVTQELTLKCAPMPKTYQNDSLLNDFHRILTFQMADVEEIRDVKIDKDGLCVIIALRSLVVFPNIKYGNNYLHIALNVISGNRLQDFDLVRHDKQYFYFEFKTNTRNGCIKIQNEQCAYQGIILPYTITNKNIRHSVNNYKCNITLEFVNNTPYLDDTLQQMKAHMKTQKKRYFTPEQQKARYVQPTIPIALPNIQLEEPVITLQPANIPSTIPQIVQIPQSNPDVFITLPMTHCHDNKYFIFATINPNYYGKICNIKSQYEHRKLHITIHYTNTINTFAFNLFINEGNYHVESRHNCATGKYLMVLTPILATKHNNQLSQLQQVVAIEKGLIPYIMQTK